MLGVSTWAVYVQTYLVLCMKPKPDLHSVGFQHYWMTYLIVYNRYGAHVKKIRACAKRAVLQLRGSAGDWCFGLRYKTSL